MRRLIERIGDYAWALREHGLEGVAMIHEGKRPPCRCLCCRRYNAELR